MSGTTVRSAGTNAPPTGSPPAATDSPRTKWREIDDQHQESSPSDPRLNYRDPPTQQCPLTTVSKVAEQRPPQITSQNYPVDHRRRTRDAESNIGVTMTIRLAHNLCMELRRDEITLREPQPADAAAITDAVQASLVELSPWMPWATSDYDQDSALRWIKGEFGDTHRFAIFDVDDALIGGCGLKIVDSQNKRANLGYWVRSNRTGRGVATTATNLLARHGIKAGLHRIEIVASTLNPASRRVAERAGAQYEGIARDRLLLRGKYHDAHVLSFVPDDLA